MIPLQEIGTFGPRSTPLNSASALKALNVPYCMCLLCYPYILPFLLDFVPRLCTCSPVDTHTFFCALTHRLVSHRDRPPLGLGFVLGYFPSLSFVHKRVNDSSSTLYYVVHRYFWSLSYLIKIFSCSLKNSFCPSSNDLSYGSRPRYESLDFQVQLVSSPSHFYATTGTFKYFYGLTALAYSASS